MKASELRIGNLILGLPLVFNDREDWEVCEVVVLDSVNETDYEIWVSSKSDSEQFAEFEPIPLTEEWLIKCGIIKASDNYFVMGCYYLEFHNDVLIIALKDGIIAKYKHVHQLQNLYFALTQKELEIK